MGSPATPPWMSELIKSNHKIVRNMWSSSESYFEGDKLSPSSLGGNKNQVVDPLSPTSSLTTKQPSASKTQPIAAATHAATSRGKSSHRMATVVSEQMQKTRGANNTTEKTSPIREDNVFMSDDGDSKIRQHYMRNGEEEIVLEYGPGIVRKLRSRYQSLALRQFSSRPSLKRSASLENVLDAELSSGEGILSPSPIPMDENSMNIMNNKLVEENKSEHLPTSMTKSKSATTVLENGNRTNEKKPLGSRGRAARSETKDRMRRARSVDALHRTKHEEEILEKFKAVVLPKEEIVIIEVSKPKANLNGLGLSNNSSSFYLTTTSDKTYPSQLLISPERPSGDLTFSDNQNQPAGIRGRSFTSPEHELPPHDIVRETARIFEKNQENLSISNGSKKIGQALRLSKSASLTSNSTNAQSPPPPSPTQQQRGTVMAQEVQSMQQFAEKRDKSPSTAPCLSGVTNPKPNANHVHGPKQVGIIRPTLSHATSNSSNGNGEKAPRNIEIENQPIALSPILSPTNHPYKNFLQNLQKPPLSPKPIFTSSPKPSLVNSQKFVKSPSIESSLVINPTTNVNNSNAKPTVVVRNVDSASPVSSKPSSNYDNNLTNRNKSPTISSEDKHIIVSKSKPVINGGRVSSPTKNFYKDSSKENSFEYSPKVNEQDSLSRQKRNLISDPLKHVPNSFTLNSSSPIHEPIHVPKPSPRTFQQNGNGIKTPSVTPIEQPRIQKATAKIEETPKILNVTKPETPNTAVSPLPSPPVVHISSNKVETSNNNSNASQLRVHQKQKSNQGSNSSMVFNFTSRSSVPDYIEDDGLNKGRFTLAGTVNDESEDNVDSINEKFDIRQVKFEGANVIINGRSSIQKKPKSARISISFNESATTTYEYPSESSLLAEDDSNEKDMLGHKGPNVLNNSGNGLGSYTPRQANNDYQLGNFVDAPPTKKADATKSNKQNESELIEDYLKPDSETTTWSNEITADILF